jgi:hypothetical protein
MAEGDLSHEEKVPLSVFSVSKQGIRHLAGSIVDCAYQGQIGSSSFQPIMPAAVNLQHHPWLWSPLPPAAMLRSPPFARALDSRPEKDSSDRGPGDKDLFSF